MQYLLMIYTNEAAMASANLADMEALTAEYAKFTQDIVKSGHLKGGDALGSSDTATMVRVRGGKTLMTDGPFADTREQLGGDYLIEAKNLDEATSIAARIPAAHTGSIEVRPVRTAARQY